MDPTNPQENQPVEQLDTTQQETLDKSNVQKRIDEITAEKHAERKRADEYAAQVSQLTATVAEMLRAQNEQKVTKQPEQLPLPEGVDPSLAKFFDDRLSRMEREYKKQTEQAVWQIQNQFAEQTVQSQFSGLPPEVIKDAAARFTNLKRQYGDAASMEDAIAVANWQYQKKLGQNGKAYNAMGQPLSQHAMPPNANQTQSTNLVSPASLPNWDNLPHEVQWKLMDEFEKKGGKIAF